MKNIIVDSSVAIKWYIPEELETEASSILEKGDILLAPDLIIPEIGNILWKKVKKRELELKEAQLIIKQLSDHPFVIYSSDQLWQSAFDLAVLLDRTVYDCLFLSLALACSGVFVTADKRFFNALQHTTLAKSVCWLGDLKNI